MSSNKVDGRTLKVSVETVGLFPLFDCTADSNKVGAVMHQQQYYVVLVNISWKINTSRRRIANSPLFAFCMGHVRPCVVTHGPMYHKRSIFENLVPKFTQCIFHGKELFSMH